MLDNSADFRNPGTYGLLSELNHPRSISVGKIGSIPFESGWYSYIGSALNGISVRVNRHLRSNKAIHWHIDYVLKYARLRFIILGFSNKKLECTIARILLEKQLAYIQGFGCTDCNCKSHMFYDRKHDKIRTMTVQAFLKAGLSYKYLDLRNTSESQV
tara:strand:+ start:126 stop:599 length:474 start_codon:yes stop_codon:yes gene_type:complete